MVKVSNKFKPRALATAIAVPLTVTGAIAATWLFTMAEVGGIGKTWRSFDQGPASKVAILNELRGSLGYGGMIHNFKNFVLRMDRPRAARVRTSIGEAAAALAAYEARGVNDRESAALKNLAGVLARYADALAIAERMVIEGRRIAEIDKAVRVDDMRALEALAVLDDENLVSRRTSAAAVYHSVSEVTFLTKAAMAVLLGLLFVFLAGLVRFMRAQAERRRAQGALRENEQRLSGIMANVGDGIVTIDEHGVIDSFNLAAEGIFGYAADEMVGCNVGILMSEPDRRRHDGYIHDYLRTGRPKLLGIGPREVAGRHKDGSHVAIDVAISEMFHGGKRTFIGIVRDITERKRAEALLRDTEARYREIFEQSPLSIWEEDWSRVKRMLDRLARDGIRDWRDYFGRHRNRLIEAANLVEPIRINQATLDIYRAPSEEAVLAADDGENMTDGELDAFLDQLVAFAEGETSTALDANERALDGGDIVTHIRAVIPPKHRHDWSRVLTTVADITERQRAAAALGTLSDELSEANRQLDAALGNMMQGLAMFDRELRLVMCNRRYLDIFDLPEELSWPGTPLHEIVEFSVERQGLDPALAKATVIHRLELARHRWERTANERLADGRIIRTAHRPLTGGGSVVTYEDITEHETAQSALRESRSRLAHAQRMARLAHWEWSAETNRLSPSAEMATMFGVSADDLAVGDEAFLRFVHPEDRGKVRAVFAGPGAEDEAYEIEYRLVRPDGEVRVVSEIGEPAFDAEGRHLGRVGAVQDITDRKHAEEALRHSEQRLANAQRIANLGNWELDIASGELTWSDEIFRIFGVKREDFDGTIASFYRAIHPDDRAAVRQSIEAAFGQGRPYGIDHRIVRPDGSVRIVSEQGEVVYDALGEPVRMTGIVHDITERKRAEAALRESETRLRRAQEIARVGDFVWDEREDRIVSRSPVIDEIYGIEGNAGPEELGDLLEFIRADDRDRVRRVFSEATRAGKPYDIEYRIVRADGEVRYVHEMSAPVFDENGEHVRSHGTLQDITERKRAEAALKQKSSFVELSKIVAAAANEASTVDEAVQICLDEVCARTGWPVGHAYMFDESTNELVPTRLWHLDDAERFATFRRVTERTPYVSGVGLPGRVMKSEVPIWIPDVTVDSDFTLVQLAENIGVKAAFGFPVLVGAKVMAVLEFFSEKLVEPDAPLLEVMAHIGNQLGRVIERKHAEKVLLSAKEQAEFANRAKSEFLANMSHELRTPLNAIIGFSEMIDRNVFGPVGNPKYIEYARHIHASGGHLLELINDILDLSKIEAGKIELCEENIKISRLIRSCLALVKERIVSQGLDLRHRVPDNLPGIYADERKLKQIVTNLLSNAVKFTPSGGTVELMVTAGRRRGLIIRVIDNGIGIAAEDIPTAMAPFGQVDSTLSRKYEGTGLGLPLARSLVELHGGTLELESEIGIGTTVTVRLPHERLVRRRPEARRKAG